MPCSILGFPTRFRSVGADDTWSICCTHGWIVIGGAMIKKMQDAGLKTPALHSNLTAIVMGG
jgi:hypothetical protein